MKVSWPTVRMMQNMCKDIIGYMSYITTLEMMKSCVKDIYRCMGL
jgi:hypothetical protein